jgi:2-polyprenyl-3-methyl-5-hydroxy-6-metoxy-1,4-benzoquinol methylase
MLKWYDFLSSARGITSAADVQRLTDHYAMGYRRLLGDVLPADKNSPIYDAGCGPGLTLNILKSLGYHNLEGTDLSSTSIAIASELGLNAIMADSIEDLASRPDHSFSRIFAVDLIEHLEKSTLIRFLEVTRTKLRTDGMLILRCPNGDSPIVGRHLFNDVTHIWTYTSTALAGILTLNGFKGTIFLDETQPFVESRRWLRTPILKAASALVRLIIKAATRENIEILAPSFWIIAKAT